MCVRVLRCVCRSICAAQVYANKYDIHTLFFNHIFNGAAYALCRLSSVSLLSVCMFRHRSDRRATVCCFFLFVHHLFLYHSVSLWHSIVGTATVAVAVAAATAVSFAHCNNDGSRGVSSMCLCVSCASPYVRSQNENVRYSVLCCAVCSVRAFRFIFISSVFSDTTHIVPSEKESRAHWQRVLLELF